MSAKPPKSPGISPSKLKTVDVTCRDVKPVSKLKKLKRRLSASFGRLSLSKEENEARERHNVVETISNEHHVGADGSRRTPLVFHSLNVTPDHTLAPHRAANSMATSLDEMMLHQSPGYQYAKNHDTKSSHLSGRIRSTGSTSSGRESRCKSVIESETSVKRHHSVGDVLGAGNGASTSTTTVCQRNNTPVKPRILRPKSEGNFNIEGLRAKRASSFGSKSPFGKLANYEKKEQLGEGSYATVYKGLSLLTNKIVALKEIRLQPDEGTPFTAIREASLLKGLKHANIVTLHDIVHTKDSLTFVFEYLHTDLGQYLEKHPGGLNPRNVKLFLFQLLRGLAFCHARQILHRDLKPQNLLLSEVGELKLADFGLARAKSIPSRTYSHEVVTLWYRPPDVLLGSTDYSTSLDMWGVGCIFTEMVTGTATFPGTKDAWDQLDKIWQVLGTPTEETWDGVSSYPNFSPSKFGWYLPRRMSHIIPKLVHIPYSEILAHNLLQLQPKKRITAQDALRHPFFADLPTKIFDLSNDASIFSVAGIQLAPELDELLRSHIRTNPLASQSRSKPLRPQSHYNGPSAV